MHGTMLTLSRPIAVAAILIAAGGAAAILGAYYFQYVVGLPPCPMCLEERIPYYVAIPLALVVALAAWREAPRGLLVAGLGLVGLVMLFNAGFGVFHAGVEWKWWQGPRDCTGPINDLGAAGDLLNQLQSIAVVRCDEAAWRLFGLSLAGYNAIVSFALAVIAVRGVRGATRGAARATP